MYQNRPRDLVVQVRPPPEGVSLAGAVDQVYLRALLRRLEAAELSPRQRGELLHRLRNR